MIFFDLSHIISPDMSVYPGTDQPVLKTCCSIEKEGFLEKEITISSHTGTHIDAPAHLINDGKTLDLLDVGHFHGSAMMLNFEKNNSKTIDITALKPHEKEIGAVDFFLIHTGWSKYWGKKEYFSDYPVLTIEAADWLSNLQLKGIGFDSISADTSKTDDYPVHKILLKKNIIIIENLINLLSLPESAFSFSCFPLKFEKADGSPVRAVAYV